MILPLKDKPGRTGATTAQTWHNSSEDTQPWGNTSNNQGEIIYLLPFQDHDEDASGPRGSTLKHPKDENSCQVKLESRTWQPTSIAL